jgi:hypothetical protein
VNPAIAWTALAWPARELKSCMADVPKPKQEHRYYLLPGMGRSNRRHRLMVLRWSIVAGIIFSAIFGVVLYFASLR